MGAIESVNPGQYFQSTATIVTAAHGFMEIVDAISEDTHFELEFRNEAKRLGEKILEKIKTIVEAAKVAVRDHPNPRGVSLLKAEALELAKVVKSLQASTKPRD